MTPVTGTRQTMPKATAHARVGAPVVRSLLPPPPIAGPADYQDAVMILMAAQVDQAGADRSSAAVQAQKIKVASERAMNDGLQANARQREAERAARGFWGFLKKIAGAVAKIAAAVAAAALAVFSGGATLPAICAVATIALSGGAALVRETRMFGELSDKVGMGLDIAAIATCGTGAIAGLAGAAPKVVDSASAVMSKVANGAQLVAAGGSAVAGASTAVVAGFQREADLAVADGEAAREKQQLSARERQSLGEWVQRIREIESDAHQSTTKLLEGMHDATNVAINGMRA